jgi:hypothetical protein
MYYKFPKNEYKLPTLDARMYSLFRNLYSMNKTTELTKQNLLPNKSIRYEPDVYEAIEKQAEQQGIKIDKLVRAILREWFENNSQKEHQEVSNSDLMIKLEKMELMLASFTQSKEVPVLNNLNPMVELNQEKGINNPDPLPSKKFTFENFLTLSEEEHMGMAEFFLDCNLGDEFGKLPESGSMELKGEILSKFEERFGTVKEVMEEVPF